MESIKPTLTMPAEWEHHSAVWLAWPHDKIAFPKIEKVENDIVKLIQALYWDEPVELLVLNNEMRVRATKKLQTAGVETDRINFRVAEYLGGWMRDVGGIFVKDQENKLHLVKFVFNIWGNKFPELKIDENIPDKVAAWVGIPLLESSLVAEGGGLEVNGEGILLTTEQCLLNPNRNPNLTKSAIEKHFSGYLGIKKTVWLKKGLLNDHTDGHIDDIAKFVSPTKILCAYEDDPDEENHQPLKDNYETLCTTTNLDGSSFEVIKLPLPHFKYTEDKPFEGGLKAPASYINFYIGNSVVLVPIFNDSNDEKALAIIQSCFPDKKIVPIESRDLVYGGGTVHCLTQQQPT